MTAYELEVLTSLSSTSSPTAPTNEKDDEYSIPLDISDLITICREYSKLNWQIQGQMEDILDLGVESAINKGSLLKDSLPHIKNFLGKICANAYFGDATSQANDCIELIKQYEEDHKISIVSSFN